MLAERNIRLCEVLSYGEGEPNGTLQHFSVILRDDGEAFHRRQRAVLRLGVST